MKYSDIRLNTRPRQKYTLDLQIRYANIFPLRIKVTTETDQSQQMNKNES